MANEIRLRLAIEGGQLVGATLDGVGNRLDALDSRAQSAAQAMRSMTGALAGLAGGIGLSQIIALTDSFTKFTAQLKLASDGAAEYRKSMDDVYRISKTAQASIQDTGVLYARIANGVRELGVGQARVATITESVGLALKVSGASATESASAMLQLSQAFASGALRGEEFNAVNEAAPRLMKALADGMGVPIGALKDMASNGLITAQVMSDAIPRALADLREEAKQVETISGAFQVLKNEVLLFVGSQAQSSGVVSTLTGLISALANNLQLLAGVMLTVAASKIAATLSTWATGTYTQMIANRALAASTLELAVTSTASAATQATASAVATAAKFAESQAAVVAAVATSNLAAARVAELRSAVLAAEGEVALAITTNGLIPAQVRLTVAEEALAIALSAQAVAASNAAAAGAAATVASAAHTAAIEAQTVAATLGARVMGVLRGALAFLGGPIGAITLLLGLGATAWAVWGSSATSAEKKAANGMSDATADILGSLDKQIKKLKERAALANVQLPINGLENGAARDQVGALQLQIDALKGSTKEADLNKVNKLLKEQGLLYTKINEEQKLAGTDAVTKTQKAAAKLWEETAPKVEQVNRKIKEQRDLLGAAFTPELEKRMRDMLDPPTKSGAATAAKAIKKEAKEASDALGFYNDLMDVASGYTKSYAEEQNKLALALKTGSINYDQYTGAVQMLLDKQPFRLKAIKDEEEATKSRVANTVRAINAELDAYYKSRDAITDVDKALNDLARTNADYTDALEFEESLMGQGSKDRAKAIEQYKLLAKYKAEAAKIEETITDPEVRASKLANLAVQQAQAISNAARATELAEWQKTADGISDALTNAFMGAIDGTKSAWVSLRDGIVNMFKTMVLRPQIQAIMNPISGAITSSLFGTAANAATGASATSGLIGTGGTIANWFTPVNTAISQFGVAALESTQALFGLANAGTAATISELAGTSSLASQLGGAVPYAAIALLAAAVIDKIANAGEQRFGASYTADATGKATLQNAPSGGEIVAKTARDIFEATQKNINQVLKDIGSNATVAGFVAGLESSGDGKGFAYAGGTIDGKGFGDYKGRDGGQFAMGSRSAEQALVDYANEMRKATLEALQAATDIPATISEQLAGVNIDSLTGEQLTALESAVGKTIAEIKATITGLQALPIAGFSDLSANAAGNLIKASGGFDKLNTSVTAYYSGFVSDNDKLAKTFASTGESFGKLGLAMPGVNGGLKDWYEGAVDAAAAMDLTKPANAQHLADLLASAEAMNAVLGPMDAFSESMQALPWQFDMLKNMSYEAATGLAAAAGGFDALAGNLNSFYSNFYTEEERSAQSLSTLAAGFTQIGLAMPAVDSGLASWYRAAVETSLALDQSVPGNAAFTASLLAMNGAVASAVKTNTSMAGSAKDSAAAGINAVKAVDTSSLALDNLAQAAQSPAEKLAATSESLDTAASAAVGLTSAINPVASAFETAASGITDAVNAINALTITNPAVTAASPDGSHADGLAYVPFDGYLAELHRGERVLTAAEASRMAMTTRDAATDTGATEVIDATSDYAKALKAVADEIKGFVDDLADIGKSPFTLALEKIHDEAIKRAEELANASKAPSGDAGGNNSIPSNFFYNLETSYSNQLNKILTGNIRGSDSLNVALGYQSSIDMMLRNAASLDNKSLSFSGTPQTESQRSEYMKMYQNYSGDIFGQVESAIKDAANGGKSIADLVTEIRARDSNGNGLIQAQNINLANLIEKYATSDLIKKVQEEESKKNYTYTGGQDYSQAFQAIKDLADGKLNGTDQETAKMFIARDFDKWFKTRQSDDIRDSAGINNQVQPKIADLLRARIPTVIGDDGLPVYKNVTQSEIDTGKEFLTGQIEAIVKNSLDGTKSIADSLEEMRINGVGDYADIAKQVLTPEYMAKAAAAAAAGDNSYAGGAELVSTLEEFYKSLGLEIGGDTGSGSDAIDPTIAAWEKAQTELLYAQTKATLTQTYAIGETSAQAAEKLKASAFDVSGLSADGIKKYFADLVAASDPLTEEGQKTIQSIADLGDSITLLGQVAQERQSWQDKLDVLSGNTTEAALQRQADLASTTDAATIAIIAQVHAQEDAAKVAAATQDYTLQMLAAQGESGAAELKALERNIDAKEKLEAGWTQTQIDSLNSVLDAAEAAADAAELLNTKLDLQATLFELTGDKLAAAAVLEAQRNIELAALDPTLRSLQTEIWGLQDAAEAAAKATEATNLKKNWQDQLDTLLDTTGATGRRIALEKDLATTTDAGTQALIRHFHAQTNYNSALANLETAQGAVKSVQDRGTDAYLSALSAQESAQQAIADIAKTAAKETYNAAMALRELGKTLREYATEQTAAPSARFADLLKKALTGDKEALQGLTGAATAASTQAKEQAPNVVLAQARIMAGVMKAALLAEATALPENPEVDPLIAANEALTKANTDVADALRVANAIQASLTKSVDDLIKEYADAKAKQVTAQTEFDAAKQVLEDIKNNTANTNISVTDLNGKLVTELTVTAKSEIEKLIKFVSNTDKLPADLKALALSAGDAFNKTVSFILGSDISEYNKKFALAAATDFARVYNLVAGSDLSAELKKHAFDTVTAFNRTINVIAGATLPADIVTQAFGATTNLNRMVEIVAGSSLSGPLKTQAFDIGTKITRLVELVSTSTSIPNDLKGLAFGAAEDITRLVNLTAGSTLSDPLKAQAFGLGTEVLRTVSLYADSTSMPNDLKQQAFSAGTAISRVLNLAAYTGNPEFFKEAYAAGEDLNRAIVLAESSDMSADLKKLAIGQATEEFVRAVRATGSITADQRAVLNAVTGTVDKVLNTSATGGSMTSTQQAILYATGGTAYKELYTYVTGGSMTPGQQAILNAITGGSSSYVYMSGNVTFDPNNTMLSIFQAIQNQTYTTVQYLKAVHNALYYISRDQWTGDLLYAKGGVFTNSIVDTPTRFALGQMGEAGPEAIMPLHRDASGSLGVMARLQSPQQNNEVLVAEIRALRETNERMERRLASIEAASKATTLHTANTADSTRRMDTQGVMVFTDPAEPLSTQAA